ncbi:MAG: hypothetical protein JO319_15120 [Acidobacteriaceae bacterium]|nr:hypothetical protein [Acidobacteriaceae bacterium]
MRRAFGYAAIVVCLLLVGAGIYIERYLKTINPRIKERVVAALSDRFDADVTLDSIAVSVYPEPNVTGEGLSIRHRQWPDHEPIIFIKRFYARTSFSTLVERSNRVSLLRLEGLTIYVPPRGRAAGEQKTELNHQVGSSEPGQDRTRFRFLIETIEANGARLEIAPKTAGKEPLRFDFSALTLHSAGRADPMRFSAKLTNPKPPGLIDTTGTFGPWQRDDPRATALAGEYSFRNADLGVFKGIAGTLSSTGRYKGVLQAVEVDGSTDTPDFTLKRGGDSVHLQTTFHSVVNGTDGDTLLDPVRASFRKSEFVCRGGIEHHQGRPGKTISLDAQTTQARMEDILALVVGGRPFVTGDVDFQSKIVVPPGKEDVIDKLMLDGRFRLMSARFSSAKVEERLTALSDRARGISRKEQKEERQGQRGVASELSGTFKLERGTVVFSRLGFSVPGAHIRLAGTYNLPSGETNMKGIFRMHSTLAGTQSGIKHVLLMPLDPLFEKDGAGFEVPIFITGTREHPDIKAEVFHRRVTIH